MSKNKDLNRLFMDGVFYDRIGQQIFAKSKERPDRLILDLRGWGYIQHMFPTVRESESFQDQVGEFVADAINEKMGSDFISKKELLESLEEMELSEALDRVDDDGDCKRLHTIGGIIKKIKGL